MQQSTPATVEPGLERCAAAVLDVGLLISRFVRAHMLRHRPARLSVVQFRALTFLNAHPGTSPSTLADHLMISRAAVSRLIDELVRRRLVARRAATDDRRRLLLTVTTAGQERLESFFTIARALVADRLASLPAAQRADVTRAMLAIRDCFAAPAPAPAPAPEAP